MAENIDWAEQNFPDYLSDMQETLSKEELELVKAGLNLGIAEDWRSAGASDGLEMLSRPRPAELIPDRDRQSLNLMVESVWRGRHQGDMGQYVYVRLGRLASFGAKLFSDAYLHAFYSKNGQPEPEAKPEQ